jgi:hypothetical protein
VIVTRISHRNAGKTGVTVIEVGGTSKEELKEAVLILLMLVFQVAKPQKAPTSCSTIMSVDYVADLLSLKEI